MTSEEQPQRSPFHEIFFTAASEFSVAIMQEVPELRGVTIVPCWDVQQDRLPFGVIKGRNGPLQNAADMMQMLMQLHGTYDYLLKQVLQLLQAVDRRAGDIATVIEQRYQELESLELAISEKGRPDVAIFSDPETPHQ